jgi:hypothetical protein
MAKLAADQGLEVIKPELGTKPRVYYKNLWRFSKCFIAGSVSGHTDDGTIDCFEGAVVRLLKDGDMVAEASTDNYGDFKFDRLNENSGEYIVEISTGRSKKTLTVQLGVSINLGEIRL